MVYRSLYLGILAFISCITIFASDHNFADSTFALEEVVVKGNRLNDFAVGSTVQKIDSLTLFRHHEQSLADLLGSETSLAIKSYGPGGIASTSLRGGGSRHTALLWNGLNLQSPMNASFNYSSIPVNFIDGIYIQYGGAGTLFGSGATTGTIHLDNQLKFNESALAESGGTIGSFQTYSQQVKGVYSSKSFATAIRFSHRSSANDFTFRNNEQLHHPMDTLKNAAFKGYSFMQQNAFKLGEYSIIRTDFWIQKYDKQVPSLISDMEPGDDHQNDENIRVSINSSHYLSGLNLNTRFGLLHDKVLFNDSKSHSLTIVNEVEGKFSITSHHKINLGVNYTYETAYASGYIDDPSRDRVAVFGSYAATYLFERVVSVFNFRQEIVNQDFIPFVYSLATRVECMDNFFVKWNISRNYSLPTFNDLYWRKSMGVEGNPNLKPESGLSYEGGLEYQKVTDKMELKHSVSVYRSEIKNWIIWLPNSEGTWKPGNFEEGLSKGFEWNSVFGVRFADLRIRISGMYSLTYAKPITTGEENTDYEDEQMIYVPRNKASGNILFGWKTINVSYAHSYTDQRYTSPGQTLDAFHLGEASVSYNFKRKEFLVNIFFKADNIWNSSYQLTKGYAMPGRSFTAGLNFKFHSK